MPLCHKSNNPRETRPAYYVPPPPGSTTAFLSIPQISVFLLCSSSWVELRQSADDQLLPILLSTFDTHHEMRLTSSGIASTPRPFVPRNGVAKRGFDAGESRGLGALSSPLRFFSSGLGFVLTLQRCSRGLSLGALHSIMRARDGGFFTARACDKVDLG